MDLVYNPMTVYIPPVIEILKLVCLLVATCLSLYTAIVVPRKVHAVHVDINSRMTQLLEVSKDLARVEGINAGKLAIVQDATKSASLVVVDAAVVAAGVLAAAQTVAVEKVRAEREAQMQEP